MQVESPAGQAQETGQVETHAWDEEQFLDSSDNPIGQQAQDPWQLVKLAEGKSPAERNTLLLEASDLFLDAQHYSTAYSMFEEVDSGWLDRDQQVLFLLVRARYELLTGQPDQARSLLAQVRQNPTISRENYIRRLQLEIAMAAQQLDFQRTVLTRIELDPLLNSQRQLDNQRRILATLTREKNLFSGDAMLAQNQALQGWLALAELNRENRLNENELALWQQSYPDHPALIYALLDSRLNGEISSRQIALLLPLTSRLGRAAQSFRAGFEAAARNNGQSVSSRVYDIGNEPALVGFYYQSAINDGADFIVGPLGRSGAQSLLAFLGENEHPGVSTLLLGELGEEQAAIPNLWGLSLAPEQEATAIAERAISQGMRSALLLEKNNPWGARLADAFVDAFESRGGQVVARQRFQPGQADPSVEIKKLLDIPSSDLRHQRLQNLLGKKLQFSVNRRHDVDFIFLAGNTVDARRIVPLAKFYRAHDLPIYATSSAYNGGFNKLTDEDLKGLRFTDLPWLINGELALQEQEKARLEAQKKAAEISAQAAGGQPVEPSKPQEIALPQANSQQPTLASLPSQSATLNRLYALGFAAYMAIPQLRYLQSDQWYRLESPVMPLSMDHNRNLRHAIAFAQYAADGIILIP